jgi:phosphoribosylamine--glycine ligase
VLPLLETDLVDICLAVLDGRLDQIDIRWQDRNACCVVLASVDIRVPMKRGIRFPGWIRSRKVSFSMLELGRMVQPS